MDTNITQLIFTESGGFAGLQRGCTLPPDALPEAPRGQLQNLLLQPHAAASQTPALSSMPDMQLYTLELVTQPGDAQSALADRTQHWVLQYPASDVPDDLADLIDYLREHAQPLPLSQADVN
jgi:hypothetical protein